YGTVFCDAAGCGTGGGTAGPRTGSFWAWFGGSGTGDVGYISQTLVLTPGVTTLNFYLWIGTSAGGASDYIKASIDGTPVFTATGANIGNYSTYTLVSVNISQFATGGAHSLRFDSTTVGSGNFNVDDVSVDISGLPSGSCSPNALPWVSAVPVSGTTVADGSSSVNVVFNSTGIAPGSYSGFLCLNTNDATHAKIEIPVATTIGADLTLVYHDLEDIVHTGETLFVGGDFNGWNATATQMTANADNSVFTATVPVTLTSVQLKYIVYTDTLHSGPANWNWLQSNNRVVTMTGNTTVDHYRNIEPGYYVLQWPYATSTVVGVPTENIFGQVWADDLTARSGAPRGLAAELGYGMASDAALWAWQTMGWSSQAGNNDEFVSSIVPTATGVYSYAVRYNGNWGVGNPHNTWYYGDKNWGTPFSTTEAGVLTVTDRRGVTLSPATNMLLGKVGSVVTHTLRITNTGSTTDTFDLTVTGNTWAVNLSATSLTLGAGQGATVYAYVNIPADVKTSDTATVKAVSQADATKQATAVLTTAVKYFIYYWPVIRR
ncbi:MAG TPA: hypothetical protein VFF59_09520, partial [Anaerolineae bacterium]|nr:hypothetical protein [Anaerolineae bacterium]